MHFIYFIPALLIASSSFTLAAPQYKPYPPPSLTTLLHSHTPQAVAFDTDMVAHRIITTTVPTIGPIQQPIIPKKKKCLHKTITQTPVTSVYSPLVNTLTTPPSTPTPLVTNNYSIYKLHIHNK